MPAIGHHQAATGPALSVARGVFHVSKRLLSRILPRHATNTISANLLKSRGDIVAIPTIYAGLDSGPSPGTVVGATLGAVAGFLILVWLFSTLSIRRRGEVVDEEIVVREREPRRRSRRSEMRSVSRTQRPERVIRQERIVRDTSRAPPPMTRSEFIVEERSERRVEGDDVVEVIEEVSSIEPLPRRKSRRSGSYRLVTPDVYGGGDYPPRPIY